MIFAYFFLCFTVVTAGRCRCKHHEHCSCERDNDDRYIPQTKIHYIRRLIHDKDLFKEKYRYPSRILSEVPRLQTERSLDIPHLSSARLPESLRVLELPRLSSGFHRWPNTERQECKCVYHHHLHQWQDCKGKTCHCSHDCPECKSKQCCCPSHHRLSDFHFAEHFSKSEPISRDFARIIHKPYSDGHGLIKIKLSKKSEPEKLRFVGIKWLRKIFMPKSEQCPEYCKTSYKNCPERCLPKHVVDCPKRCFEFNALDCPEHCRQKGPVTCYDYCSSLPKIEAVKPCREYCNLLPHPERSHFRALWKFAAYNSRRPEVIRMRIEPKHSFVKHHNYPYRVIKMIQPFQPRFRPFPYPYAPFKKEVFTMGSFGHGRYNTFHHPTRPERVTTFEATRPLVVLPHMFPKPKVQSNKAPIYLVQTKVSAPVFIMPNHGTDFSRRSRVPQIPSVITVPTPVVLPAKIRYRTRFLPNYTTDLARIMRSRRRNLDLIYRNVVSPEISSLPSVRIR